MSATSRPVPITVEQYEHFEGYPGLRDELIYGEIVISPRAKPLHRQIATAIEQELKKFTEGTIWLTRGHTNIKFPALNSMPAPDVLVVRRDDWFKAAAMKCISISLPSSLWK